MTPETKAEIIRINTEARPLALQIALLSRTHGPGLNRRAARAAFTFGSTRWRRYASHFLKNEICQVWRPDVIEVRVGGHPGMDQDARTPPSGSVRSIVNGPAGASKTTYPRAVDPAVRSPESSCGE